MKIILTGGRGMVGKNLMEHDLAERHEVLAPSRTDLDLTDFDAVSEYFASSRPELVIHAAGKVGGIQANIREPVQFLTENLDIGRNVVLAASKTGITRLLNLGSSCMYPREAENPLREPMILTGALEPTNEGYALAKIVTARLCSYLSTQYESLDYKTLVPCNIFGRYDKFDPAHSHLVPALIHKIHLAVQQRDDTVEIWGSGEARREFLYAGDLAGCIWRAVAEFESLPSVMNVGVGADHTINEYYRAVADVVGFEGVFTHDLNRPVGMMQKLVDSSAADEWGWRATTSLRDGIRQAYQYYLEEFAQ